jgi:hypothetical protein
MVITQDFAAKTYYHAVSICENIETTIKVVEDFPEDLEELNALYKKLNIAKGYANAWRDILRQVDEEETVAKRRIFQCDR